LRIHQRTSGKRTTFENFASDLMVLVKDCRNSTSGNISSLSENQLREMLSSKQFFNCVWGTKQGQIIVVVYEKQEVEKEQRKRQLKLLLTLLKKE